MKSTGIVRKIDDLGRVVIPMEIRRVLNVAEKDPMEVFINGDEIILKKYTPGCSDCGEINVKLYGEKTKLCRNCVEKLAEETKF